MTDSVGSAGRRHPAFAWQVETISLVSFPLPPYGGGREFAGFACGTKLCSHHHHVVGSRCASFDRRVDAVVIVCSSPRLVSLLLTYSLVPVPAHHDDAWPTEWIRVWSCLV